jgi:hypothetical protein
VSVSLGKKIRGQFSHVKLGVWIKVKRRIRAKMLPEKVAFLNDLGFVRMARYGYRSIHVLLEREGWRVNHKLVYRLYV